jgi:O-acetyl-ADP-ribose deacetylase (regulator of RNase III)
MPSVFINFRGHSQAGFAALLDRELSQTFGPDAVFLSSRSIRPGDDFVTEILRNLRQCRVLIAVIGPDWLTHGTVAGGEDPQNDWVRREIAEAFVQGIRVVPVLVEDAPLPTEAQMPADISALSRCQYLRLHHRSFDYDLARVAAELRRLLEPSPTSADGMTEAPAGPAAVFALSSPRQSPCRVGVIPGNIGHVRVADTWVNSENTDMEMSRFNEFTISGVIRYLGARRDVTGAVMEDVIAQALAHAVGTRRPVAAGTAFVTESGALAESHNVRHIIHVAAVHGEPGAGFRQVHDLGSCVTNALAQAQRLAATDDRVRSVLFPLLGTGVGGGAADTVTAAMINAIMAYLVSSPTTELRMIYILGYTKNEFRVLTDRLSLTAGLERVTD